MAIADVDQRAPASAASDFLGHPRGLAFLFSTEMWERFSYYGMRALLTLYMVKYLLLPDRSTSVIGYGAIKQTLEWTGAIFGYAGSWIWYLVGSIIVFIGGFLGDIQAWIGTPSFPVFEVLPRSGQALASLIYGTYTGLVYATPLIGGLIADRWLGQHITIIIGASLMAIGHFMMAFEPLFFLALIFLICGNGCFKPNMSAQVGGLYQPGDHRRDRAYSIFYVGINLGALLAPLVCGTLGEYVGWHWGFGAAGVGMVVALLTYIYALWSRALPMDPLHRAQAAHVDHQPLTREEKRRVWALVFLFLPVILFWGTYEQQGNTIALWADDHTDRSINLLVWSGEIPVTWFQAFNPFMIIAFTPFVIALWAWQAQRGREPSTVTKMSLGCFGCALSYVIMAGAAWHAGGDEASWLWLFFYFVVITIGELYLSPIGLSLVSKVAPVKMVSFMMGVWLATSFIGGFLSGWLGTFWSSMDKVSFFLMLAAVVAAAGAVIFAFNKPLRAVLD